MTTTVDAIYEHGKLVLPRPLSLPEKSRVRVTIESEPERRASFMLSDEPSTKVRDQGSADVFNELAAMANDPQIQRELRSINAEFARAESDGLRKNLMAIERGDIYLVDLNPVQGREQAGRRPVLVLSVNAINKLPLVVTVVIGTKGENVTRDYPTNVRIPAGESGLPMETVFLCFQLRSLDPSRFADAPAGKVSGTALGKIENAIRHCLGL